MRINLPTTLFLAGAALLFTACTTSTTPAEPAVPYVATGNTAQNIRSIAKEKQGPLAVALNDLADREEENGCSLECRVQSIRYHEAGEAWAQRVMKNGRVETNTPGAMLPACYAIHIVPVPSQVKGGSGTYFYDTATGALLGMTLYK